MASPAARATESPRAMASLVRMMRFSWSDGMDCGPSADRRWPGLLFCSERIGIAEEIAVRVVARGLAPGFAAAVAANGLVTDHLAGIVVVVMELPGAGGSDRGDRGAGNRQGRQAESKQRGFAHGRVSIGCAGGLADARKLGSGMFDFR